MAHYAFIDENNIVVEVIPGRDEVEIVNGILDWEAYYSSQRPGLTAKRTSYNTRGGVHGYGGVPFRKNYAGEGFTYDGERDAFIPSQPFPSWLLNEETCTWESPVPYPKDGQFYEWDESILNWSLVTEEGES